MYIARYKCFTYEHAHSIAQLHRARVCSLVKGVYYFSQSSKQCVVLFIEPFKGTTYSIKRHLGMGATPTRI